MAQLLRVKQMNRQVSHGSAVDYEADEQAGVARLSWRISSRCADRCRAAQLAIIKKMSRQCRAAHLSIIEKMCMQVSRGPAGVYQADEQAGVARRSWR